MGDIEGLEKLVKKGNNILFEAQERGDIMLYNMARNIFMDVINNYPDYSRGFSNLGVAFFGMKKYKDAVKAFTQSLNIEDNKPNKLKSIIVYNLAESYLQLNNIKAAISEYEKAIELNNNNYDAHIRMGVIKNDKKFYLDAIDHFNISLNSKNKKIIDLSNKNIENSINNMNALLINFGRKSFDYFLKKCLN